MYYIVHKNGHNGAYKFYTKHGYSSRVDLQGEGQWKSVTKNRWYHIYATWRDDMGLKVSGTLSVMLFRKLWPKEFINKQPIE